MGDLGSIPGSGRSPGEGNGNPLQYSCLENPMDGGAWWATYSPPVAKSRTRLSDFTFTLSELGLPGGSDGKESACNEGDLGSVPGWERSPGEGNGNPLQYSCLENSKDGGTWRSKKSQSLTGLSPQHFHFHLNLPSPSFMSRGVFLKQLESKGLSMCSRYPEYFTRKRKDTHASISNLFVTQKQC